MFAQDAPLVRAVEQHPRATARQLGRYASGGFDGGSRTPPPPPAPTHDQTLGELFRTKAADVGRRL